MKLAPRATFGVTLLATSENGSNTTVASANDVDRMPPPSQPLAVRLRSDGETLTLDLDGRPVLTAIPFAGPLRNLELAARGASLDLANFDATTDRAGDHAIHGNARNLLRVPLTPFLARGAAIGVGLMLLLAAWTFALGGGSLGALVDSTGFASLPLTIILVVGLIRREPPSTLAWIVACAVAALTAYAMQRIGRREHPAPIPSPPLVAGLALALLSTILLASAVRESALFAPLREAIERARPLADPESFRVAGATTLDAGTAIHCASRFRDLDLTATVELAPESILQIRLHAERSDAASLLVATDPSSPTRWVRETGSEFVTLGAPVADASITASATHRLTISVRGEEYVAAVDGAEVTRASERRFPVGSATLLAARGHAVVTDLTVTPSVARPREPDATRDLLRGAARALGSLGAAVAVATLLLRCPMVRALAVIGLATLPIAFTSVVAPVETIARPLAITAPIVAAVLGAVGSVAIARHATPLRFHLVLVVQLAIAVQHYRDLTRHEWPAEERDVNAISCLDAEANRIAPHLLHLEHPLLRRWNTYLEDHTFRGRRHSVAKPPGTRRVVAIGTSSTYGYGATMHWPGLLEIALRATHPEPVEVINAGCSGSTSWRLFHFLRDVLLEFEPDVIVLSFYYNDSVGLMQFDEASVLERLTGEGLTLGAELATRLAILRGGPRFGRDAPAFVARPFDPVAAWDVASLAPPHLRFAESIRKYAQLARERGIDLVLLQEPLSGDHPRIWKNEFREVFRQLGREYAVPVVDSTPAQLAAGAEKLFVDEIHPNASGHRVTATVLAPVVAGVLAARGRLSAGGSPRR